MNEKNINTDKRLLKMLSKGSEEAFTQIYNAYRDKVYSNALRIVKSGILAEEILQDVFLKIWLRRAEMSDVDNLESFLYILQRNLIFNYLKKISYQRILYDHLKTEQNTVSDTDFLLRQHQCHQILDEAINQLHPKQKAVYQMAKIEGLSHQAIARNLNISRLTVKKHMANSLQFLRLYLRRHFFTIGLLIPFLYSH